MHSAREVVTFFSQSYILTFTPSSVLNAVLNGKTANNNDRYLIVDKYHAMKLTEE